MPDIVVDTSILVWSYTDPNRISARALSAVKDSEANSTIYVSAISVVELIYLTERKRIADKVLRSLYQTLEDPLTHYLLIELSYDLAKEVAKIPRDEIPEMPDRIIAATASLLNLSLVTSDSKIRASSAIETIW